MARREEGLEESERSKEGSCGGIRGDQKGEGDRGGREAVVEVVTIAVVIVFSFLWRRADGLSAGAGKKRREVGVAL